MAANDASRMLSAGRRRPERSHVEVVPPSDPESQEPQGDQETRRPVAQSYVKTSAFITRDQRRWLSEVAARTKLDGIDGLSASDVVRLALARLKAEAGEGLVLVDELVAQAHAEADLFPGRKNRGLPQRPP